jgi:hypothetical protein
MEANVQKSIDLFKTGSGNVSGTPPPNTPPTANTDAGIFESAKAFSTTSLNNLDIKNGVLTGNFVVYYEDEAAQSNLEIDHDDSHAADPSKKNNDFALLIHGVQPAGSRASLAIKQLKASGVKFSYSRNEETK